MTLLGTDERCQDRRAESTFNVVGISSDQPALVILSAEGQCVRYHYRVYDARYSMRITTREVKSFRSGLFPTTWISMR